MNRLLWLALFLLAAGFCLGRDIYVSWDGTNNPPYTNWPDAAKNIEWAVNAASRFFHLLIGSTPTSLAVSTPVLPEATA